MNSPPLVFPGAQGSPPKRRASLSDLLLALGVLAVVVFAVIWMFQDLVTDQRLPLAETPATIAKAPLQVWYDPSDTRRLIGEIAGWALTLAVLAVGCWRLRRRPPEPRLAPLPAPARIGETQEKWIGSPTRAVQAAPKAKPPPPIRLATSRSVAAERLSAVVWADQLARQRESA